MTVRVIVPPAPLVTWEEARHHLRLDMDGGTEERTYVEALIAAASAWIDGPRGCLGRAVSLQTLEMTGPDFVFGPLPFPPVVDIESVIYVDPSYVEVTMAGDQYRQLSDGSLAPMPGGKWPVTAVAEPDSVRVRYRAGFADIADDGTVSAVPASIKVAALMLVGQWFEGREAVAIGLTVEAVPFAVDALLTPFRLGWVA